MIWSIYEDQGGSLWIGTFNGGLNRLDRETGTFTVYRHAPQDPTSLSSDDVRAILEDGEGDESYSRPATRLFRSIVLALEEGSLVDQYLEGVRLVADLPPDRRSRYLH